LGRGSFLPLNLGTQGREGGNGVGGASHHLGSTMKQRIISGDEEERQRWSQVCDAQTWCESTPLLSVSASRLRGIKAHTCYVATG
jgi:hypothetical protein